MPLYVYRGLLREEERAFVIFHIKRLTALSFDELCALPDCSNIPVPEALVPFSAHVYREPVREGKVRIIVQGVRETKRFLFLQFAAVEAGGFSKDQSGGLKKIEPQDLHDYT